MYICHAPPGNPANAKTHSINVNDVADHFLNHPGDRLGKCDESPCGLITKGIPGTVIDDETVSGLLVRAYPNPTSNNFTLELTNGKNEPVEIRVKDIQGRRIFNKQFTQKVFSFGHDFVSGIYIVEVIQGNQKQLLKIIKQ